MSGDTQVLLSGLAFPEAPRWRANRLWFTDQHARKIMTVNLVGVIARPLHSMAALKFFAIAAITR